jgi:hypothetical protein
VDYGIQCVNLTDELFLLALQLTTFARLTSLTLEKCHQGTTEFELFFALLLIRNAAPDPGHKLMSQKVDF